MPFVSTLKESFALAPPQERQHVVEKLAVPNTIEYYYYQGLVILQKIHDEVMKVEDPTQSRSPSEVEADLVNQLKDILSKLKAKNDYTYYNQLESRFQLLAYPFQTATTIEFLQKELSITSHQQESATMDDQETTPTLESKKLPSSLDPSLIDGAKLIQKAFTGYGKDSYKYYDLDAMAYPYLKKFWDVLDQDTKFELVRRANSFGSVSILGDDVIEKLAEILKAKAGDDDFDSDSISLDNFTLAQLDKLADLVPDAFMSTSFVNTYLAKLAPDSYENTGFWDDSDDTLKDYLERADAFAEKLPPVYKRLKSAIKHYKLRIDIIRQEFTEDNLISFLSCVSNNSINTSPLPTRAFGFRTEQTEKYVNLPLFGDCVVSEAEKNRIIEEYLVGLITQDKLTTSLESLGAYVDYHNFLKPLVAKIKLTSGNKVQDAWIRDYGELNYESLVKKSFVSFADTSLNASVKRKPEDAISLYVKTKNVSRLSVRVFQIETENYWRIHLNDTMDERSANKDINLDGFRPTFEQDFDFSSEPSIRVKYNEFKFGQEGLAAEVFQGRGLWVIEFVGGENQCRAIVQKGYLRHIIQNTFAGHVLRVLDENGQVIEKAKVLYDKQIYETDDASNILIPYHQDKSQTKKIILVSSNDHYCEPASFYHSQEVYSLEASFYMNPEMVSFNKTATVVVLPKLTLNGKRAPLSLLDDKITLNVETCTTNDIKNITTCQKSSKDGDAIRFEFLVPDQLKSIDFTLKAQVKTLNDKLIDVSANDRKTYDSSSYRTGLKANFHLRKTSDNKYYIQVFGKNGEYKKDFKLKVNFSHSFVNTQIVAQLQTNENGIVELGELKDIKWINLVVDGYGIKEWKLTEDYFSNLPSSICVAENTSVQLNCNTNFSDALYGLFSVNSMSGLLENLTGAYLKKENDSLSIQGLPAGSYRLYLPSLQNGLQSIECTVIKPQLTASSERGIWSGWLLGESKYAKQNGSFLQKPLGILETNMTDEGGVQIKLNHWNPNTFAVVTTSTFVPTDFESLQSKILSQNQQSSPEVNSCGVQSTRSVFLNDKRMSEEYQYILNRAKTEKWTGSNLTKPSLLVYPKKHADTHAGTRDFDKEVVSGVTPLFGSALQIKNHKKRMYNVCCGVSASIENEPCKDLAFLDHTSPLVVIPVSAHGTIDVDRKHLGHGGHLFQMVVISGEQSVFYQKVLDENQTLTFNDLRQSENSNKTLISSKAVSKVFPNGSAATLRTHEYETVDSFEKLFDIIVKISPSGEQLGSKFLFLKLWPSLPLKQKLETHQENVCHELNLWLKKKDPQFFEEFVKPAIKSKLQKSFIELYLIDGDLAKYQKDIYLYNNLSVAEKALLASSSGSTEDLLSTLRLFNDSFDHEKPISNSDNIFDTILSNSTLNAAAGTIQTTTVEVMSDSIGYCLPMDMAPETFSASAPAAPRSVSLFGGVAQSGPVIKDTIVTEVVEEYEDADYEDNAYADEQLTELREKAKKLRQKASYKFAEPTSEWTEAGYYSEDTVSLQKFWIDYLEHVASDDAMFVSENFMYSLNNIKEVLFVLSLMDLPFASEMDWKIDHAEANSTESKVEFSIRATSHPLLVFYRTLTECGTSSIESSRNLMLNQEIFVVDPDTDFESEDCIKINPASQSLEPLVEYGNHLVVINISSKALTCQVTVQIPTGAIPTANTSYYQSKTIYIQPYSTWYEVVGTFYFPSSGEFAIVPVTVSSISGDQLLAKIDSIPIRVSSHTEEKALEAADSSNITSQPWSKVANKGTNENVIDYIETYRKLEKLDLSLIKWRMMDKKFAEKVLDTLSKRRHYHTELWEFSVGHQFSHAIQDLLNQNGSYLLDKVGSAFESPLITKDAMDRKDLTAFDYYPLFNARTHPVKATPEILNNEFYQQYDRFLEYVSLQSNEPSDTDLVILTTYLLLQDRIGEAHKVFGRIKNLENNEHCQLQIDYLHAYLKTRLPVTSASFSQELDLQSIKEITQKYKDFGVLRWRQLFSNLHAFVCEIEQGEFAVVANSSLESQRIRSEPILEFEVDGQELVIKYANIQSVDIKYYDMDVEVMFSNNPFMDSQGANTSKNISWIKPTASETIALPEKKSQDAEEDFDMIGIGQMNALQFHRVPFTAENKNVYIEVSSGSGLTRQHAYYSNSLSVHFSESFGFVCVTSKKTKRPLPGAYIKVYCRKKGSKQVHFWKDGYTGLNGVFDYISVTQGNALTSNGSLKQLMSENIDKLSVLIMSDVEGAMVKEVYPPEEN